MSRMRDLLAWMRRSIRAKERGASLVEYALLIALIAVVCVGAVTYFGQETGSALEDTAVAVQDAHPGRLTPDRGPVAGPQRRRSTG